MNSRIPSKTLLDVGQGTINKLFDDLQTRAPQLAERCRTSARSQRPKLRPGSVAEKRLALELLLAWHPHLFPPLWKGISDRRKEPNRISPLEQIKQRTAILFPLGELTGGNYRPGSNM